MIELIVFTKANGPLTKHIQLAADGSLQNDSSACFMARGVARRTVVADVAEFAALIEQLRSNQAISLGALWPGLPDEVKIVTKKNEIVSGAIARTNATIHYHPAQPAFALFDLDCKGMPSEVAAKLQALGGFWSALSAVLPTLRGAAHVIRRSTSAGLSHADTGVKFSGSGGLHGYIVVRDGTDIERFLTTLHERCWLAGLGWMMVGVAGQLLERSVVDRMVGAPERLVFEAPPVLVPPLTQDVTSRQPMVTAGEIVDTIAICPPLTVIERQNLTKLRAEAAQRLLPERNRAREAFIGRQAQRLVQRTGCAETAAKRVIEHQTRGILLPDVELAFDDLQAITVAAVLNDPARFDGCTLADPLEGIEYGRCKAKIMRYSDGAPWIHSFAHGGTSYQLKYDAAAVRSAVTDSSEPIQTLAELVLRAELDELELKALIDDVARRAGVGVKLIAAKIKSAKQVAHRRMAEEIREWRLAQRNDPRPQLPNPAQDAPWLPQLLNINEALAATALTRRPRRDIDSTITHGRKISVPKTHPFKKEVHDDD